jgi:hypothetical protein
MRFAYSLAMRATNARKPRVKWLLREESKGKQGMLLLTSWCSVLRKSSKCWPRNAASVTVLERILDQWLCLPRECKVLVISPRDRSLLVTSSRTQSRGDASLTGQPRRKSRYIVIAPNIVRHARRSEKSGKQ